YAAEWRAPRCINQIAFGDDDEGGLAALDLGEPLTADGLLRRLARFLDGGKLGALGQLRFVYYRRAPGGGTHYFSVWTDDGFDLERLMPAPGRDVEGGDLAGVPRLPRAVRVLAVGERGRPERLRVYRGPGSVAGACRFYRDRMRAGGWVEDPDFA